MDRRPVIEPSFRSRTLLQRGGGPLPLSSVHPSISIHPFDLPPPLFFQSFHILDDDEKMQAEEEEEKKGKRIESRKSVECNFRVVAINCTCNRNSSIGMVPRYFSLTRSTFRSRIEITTMPNRWIYPRGACIYFLPRFNPFQTDCRPLVNVMPPRNIFLFIPR